MGGQVYPRARAALSQDKELLLGINCCAGCAAAECGACDCEACGKVGYCSVGCRDQDAAAHAVVCQLLQVRFDGVHPHSTWRNVQCFVVNLQSEC